MSLDEKDMQPKALKGKTFGRTIQEYVLPNVPVIVGILVTDAFGNLIHFIITSAVQHR